MCISESDGHKTLKEASTASHWGYLRECDAQLVPITTHQAIVVQYVRQIHPLARVEIWKPILQNVEYSFPRQKAIN